MYFLLNIPVKRIKVSTIDSSRYICGGCRARAYNYFHDVTYPDPGCEKNKNAWDKIIEKESSEYLAK